MDTNTNKTQLVHGFLDPDVSVCQEKDPTDLVSDRRMKSILHAPGP